MLIKIKTINQQQQIRSFDLLQVKGLNLDTGKMHKVMRKAYR
jgi:hypothetical protein